MLALVAVVGLWMGTVKSRTALALVLAACCLAAPDRPLFDQSGRRQSGPMLHLFRNSADPVVYTIGIQVGPGFFSSLRVSACASNLFAVLRYADGGVMTAVLHKLFDIPLPMVLGMFSGAVTNTPALGAVNRLRVSAYRFGWSIKWG
ncbi:hypothetical protein M8494_32725 [Serratia ureilytica]